MNRTILTPLDGSRLAERALPYVRLLATADGARVVLLRVVSAAVLPFGDAADAQARVIHEAEAYLAGIGATMVDQANVDTVVRVGDPGESILDEIHRRSADLVVMSTHGHSELGRLAYGSVADQVMRRSAVPVLLVPEACQSSWPVDRAPRILVPLDGSELAATVVPPTLELAELLRAEVWLVQAVVPPSYAYADVTAYVLYDPAADQREAHAYLDSVAAGLRAVGQMVRTIVASGFPVPTIVAEARKQGADLIAISTHGRGGVSRLVMGSVATGVVQRAPVPVLIMHPAAVRDQGDLTHSREQVLAR